MSTLPTYTSPVNDASPTTALDRLRRHLERAVNEDYKLLTCKPDEARAIREQKAVCIKFATSQIHIDSEFEALIPALTIGERQQLRNNLKAEGIRDPLVLWLTPAGELVLVDGHNRLSIAEADGLLFDVSVKEFANRDEARQWMIDNQLGRRNLTKEQRSYLLGKYVQSEKGSHGGARAKGEGAGRAIERAAEAQGVSPKAAQRAEQGALALDRIGEVSPEAKEKVLMGQAAMTQGELQSLHNAPDDVIKSVAQSIVTPAAAAPDKNWTLTIALIACSSEKLKQLGPVPARELYQGDLFKKSVAWAELQGYSWAVLSAKHGLVEPETELEPYDFSIKELNKTQAWDWMNTVVKQLETLLQSAGIAPGKHIKIVLLAGGAYCEAGTLIHRLRNVYQVETPLKGLGGIGQQKEWLLDQVRSLKAKAPIETLTPADIFDFMYDPAEDEEERGLEKLTTYIADLERARAYAEHIAKVHPELLSDCLEDVFSVQPLHARAFLQQYASQLQDWEQDFLNKQLIGMGQDPLTPAELGQPEAPTTPPSDVPLPLPDEEPESPAEPVAETPAKTNELKDDTFARTYLVGIAENDPKFFENALERVIKAKPPSLILHWSWALTHHVDLLSMQALARLENLFKQATDGGEPELVKPTMLPPADLQLCQTHKQAKPHWVIAGQKPGLCGSTYVRNWQEVKEPGQKICELCQGMKPAYETELEPYILDTSVALAYLARQQPEALPRALEQVFQAAAELAEAAIDYVTESAEGSVTPAWLELVLKRSNIHRIQDPAEVS